MPSLTKRQRLIDDLQAKIRSGEYPPGHKLPSSSELRVLYDCSHMTVRVAIDNLKATGWVVTAPGLGMFVAERPPV